MSTYTTVKHNGATYRVDLDARTALRVKGSGALEYTQVVKKRELLDKLLALVERAPVQ